MLLLALLLQAAPPSGTANLTVRLAPDTALVERDPLTGAGFANFDFLVTSGAARPLELASIVMTAHDPAGAMLLRRFCDGSGLSPCIRTMPDRALAPGASTIVYNPLPQDDPKRRRPDITRAQELLGWNPTVDRAEGLRRTLEYFRTVV